MTCGVPNVPGPANRWAGCAEAVGDMVMCARHGPTAGCRARGDSGVVATPAVRGRHVTPGRVTVTDWRAASTCRTAVSRGRKGGNNRASLSPGAGPRTTAQVDGGLCLLVVPRRRTGFSAGMHNVHVNLNGVS
jgi:hypothetical protein